MADITLTKTVPVVGEYDVIVGGGGPAGFIAAVAAARNGAKTALVERYGFFGGTATAGFVTPISEFNKHGKRIIGGIPWEFVEMMCDMGGAVTDYPIGNIPYDTETYKLAAQRLVLGAGVDLFLHTYVTDVRMEGKHLTHLVIANKSGAQAISAKQFIDATGDADIAVMAKLPIQKIERNQLQPATLCFKLGGVDTAHLENMELREENTRYYNKRVSDFLQSLPKEEKVPPFGGPWFVTVLRDGIVSVNMTRRPVDVENHQDVAATECLLREDVAALVALLKKYIPEFKNCFLLETAAQSGLRESRRILGAHLLTGEEILEAVEFPDTIAKAAHPVDIHLAGSTKQDVSFLNQAGSIPYRCLYAKGFDNLLVAGRSLSADKRAAASVRVMAPCMAMGQAAGTAAALCTKSGCAVEDLPVDVLRETLLDQKAIL